MFVNPNHDQLSRMLVELDNYLEKNNSYKYIKSMNKLTFLKTLKIFAKFERKTKSNFNQIKSKHT